MGLFGTSSRSSGTASSSDFRPRKLPIDQSVLAMRPEACHCVADAELENRYNMLRAEEHARQEGKCGPLWTTDVARREGNAERNRYASVVPWDHSRVVLPVRPGENDYINASWVQMGSKTYIACQGPLQSTVHDFWQMVYAYGGDPAVIVMLTPLYEHAVEKCAKYWPEPKEDMKFPPERGFDFGLHVRAKHHHANDQYEYSCILVTPSDPKRPPKVVHHVYYHTWLDYTRPNADVDLRALIHMVNNRLRNRASPPIIHCSAGIGRTGTFIAVDALLSHIDTDIEPSVTPALTPIWKADQTKLQYRSSLFTGEEGNHSEFGSEQSSTLLSRYDMNTVSTAPSLRDTVTTEKRNISQSVSQRTSQLSTALERMKEEGQQPENDENECSQGDEDAQDNEAEKKSTALSGPAIKKVPAKLTYVDQSVFAESPENLDVMHWFDPSDPVISTVRTMRKQRPKMVQGKQQLGYIYDQFEVGQQLARATFQHNDFIRRRSTLSSSEASSPASEVESGQTSRKNSSFGSHHHHHHLNHNKLLNIIGLRRSSAASVNSQSDSGSIRRR